MSQNVVEIIVRAVDKTKAGLTSPIKNVADLQKSITNLVPAFTFAATAAATAFAMMTKGAINSADEMGKAAQSAGVGVEKFSALAYAANLNSVNNEKLSASFKNLNGFINEANNGGEKQLAVFTQLGVAYRNADGTLRSADAVMMDLSDRFKATADGAGKSAAAVALFGKAGSEMIPFLNQGSDAIRDLQNEAVQFGQVVTGDTAQQADQFNTNLDRMSALAGGVAKQFAAGVLPALVQVTEQIVKTSAESGFFAGVAGTLVDTFKSLVAAVRFLWAGFKSVGEILGTVASIIVDLNTGIMAPIIGTFNVFIDVIKAFVQSLSGMADAVGAVGDMLVEFFSGNWEAAWDKSVVAVDTAKAAIVGMGSEVVDSWIKNGAQVGQTMVQSYENIKGATKTLAADIAKEFTDAYNFGLNLFKAPPPTSPGANEPNKPQMNLNTGGPNKFWEQWEAQYARSLAKAAEMEREFTQILTEEGLIRQQMNTVGWDAEALQFEIERNRAQEEFDDRIAKIDALKLAEEDAIKATTLAAEIKAAKIAKIDAAEKKAKDELIKSSLRNTLNTFTQAAQMASTHSKEMFAIWKGLAIAQAGVDTYTGAIAAYKAMAGIPYVGPALGAAAAAAVVAFGAAQIANIASTSFQGQAHGGLDSVPREGTYLLSGNERVVQPDANEDLTEFLAGGNGGGGPSVIQMILEGRVIGEVLFDMSRNGTVTIADKAIVAV